MKILFLSLTKKRKECLDISNYPRVLFLISFIDNNFKPMMKLQKFLFNFIVVAQSNRFILLLKTMGSVRIYRHKIRGVGVGGSIDPPM